MMRAIVFALMALLWSMPAQAEEAAPLRIDLNIPALKLSLYEGETLVRSYPVAVGQPGYPTPTGRYTISHAEWNPWWYPPTHREWARNERDTPPGPNNPMGRVKLFFMPLYFIHGTPDDQSIGTPASRGCVRMLNRDVIELSKLLHEYAAPQVSSNELERILSRPSVTRRVNFQRDVEVVIRYDPVVVERGEIFAYPDVYGYDALHSEGVYQALIAAGYDVATVSHDDVRSFIDRARGIRAPLVLPLEEVFGGRLAAL
jgi:murein L,D-transpeptidase YcbB/YkuD